MTYLYIIGPVTGIAEANRWAFMEARAKLRNAGYDADIPHMYVGSDDTWEVAMSYSLNRLLDMWRYYGLRLLGIDDSGFGIAMLPGWEDSKGARIEHDLAESLGIPCNTVEEWLNG